MSQSGGPVDTITVADELERLGLLEQVGGVEALHAPAERHAGDLQRRPLRQDRPGRGHAAPPHHRRRRHLRDRLTAGPTTSTTPSTRPRAKVFKVADRRVVRHLPRDRRADEGRHRAHRGELRPRRHDHRRRHRLRRPRRAAVRPPAVDAQHRRCATGDGQVRKRGSHRWSTSRTGEVVTAAEMFDLAASRERTRRALARRRRSNETAVGVGLPRRRHQAGVQSHDSKRSDRQRSPPATRCSRPRVASTRRGPVGDRIAMPTAMPVFGIDDLPDAEIDLLALLIGDGALTAARVLTTASTDVSCSADAAAVESGLVARSPVIRERRYGRTGRSDESRHRHAPSPRRLGQDRPSQVHSASDLPAASASARTLPQPPVRHRRHGVGRPAGYARIGYGSVSEQLARDVAHALAALRHPHQAARAVGEVPRRAAPGVRGRDHGRAVAAQVLRRDRHPRQGGGRRSCSRRAAKRAAPATRSTSCRRRCGTTSRRPRASCSWAEINRRCGRSASHNWHISRRGPLRRETVAQLAEALDDDRLRWWASPDIAWDRIVSIEPAGETRVIDFTVPEVHNFVAADLFLHNTAFGLGHGDAHRQARRTAGARVLAGDGSRRADPAHPVERGRGRLARRSATGGCRSPTGRRSAGRSGASKCRCSSTTTRG